MKIDRFLLLACLTALIACGETENEEPEESTAPVITAVDRSELVVGEPLFMRGANLAYGAGEFTRVTFDGIFRGDDGSVTPTQVTVTPVFDSTVAGGDDVMVWPRFGPFENPFGEGLGTGTFVGRITATAYYPDGRTESGEASDEVAIRVGASVTFETLQPLVANCGAPAIRGIGGLPYEMTVRAIGFTPASWRVEADLVNGETGLVVFERAATGPTLTLGWDEPFVLNPVADGERNYTTVIRAIAYDSQGRAVETALPYTVHRPLQIEYDGNYEVAEVFEPVPVSGCIPGQVGNRVTYSETQTETRQQTVSTTISSDWSRSNGITNSRNWTDGFQEGTTSSTTASNSTTNSETQSASDTYNVSHNESSSNSTGLSSSDGENWSFDVTEGSTRSEGVNRTNELSANAEVSASVTAGGSVGLPMVANGEASATVGTRVGVGASHGWGSSETVGASRSTGSSTGGSATNTASFGSVTSEGSSSSIGGSYVVGSSQSTARSLSDTNGRSESRTYSFGEGTSESEIISEGLTEAESETWSESSSHSTLTSYSAVIAPGRFGVFYRQTTRLVRRADVYSYNLCGVLEKQGEMMFNEWAWAPELAIAESCGETLPPSSLPAAECYIAPCWN